jgi:hypothetical protein
VVVVELVVVEHAPMVSPWRMCACNARMLIVIVTKGCFFECV